MKKKLGGFEMKPIFRLLVAISVIAFAAGIMAVSCGKTPADNNNNNNNNNSGGGGGTYDSSKIKITPANENVTVSGNDITIKVAAFPADSLSHAFRASLRGALSSATAADHSKVFDIEYDGATGGLVLVDKGNVTKPEDVTIASFSSAGNLLPDTFEGIQANSRQTAGGAMPVGLSFYSIFANTNAPANTDADKEPFAFTPSTDTHPIFWCTATAPAITDDITTDVSMITGFGAKTLAGAHKASCYVTATSSGRVTGTGLGTAAVATA